MSKIAIIDYGMGNLKSVAKAFERVGADSLVTRDPSAIDKVDKLVLPGVGAFSHCMKNLNDLNLVTVIQNQIAKGKPFLGVCLGLQLLFEESEEGGKVSGLGILKGRVKKFAETDELKIPHMGWNSLDLKKPSPLFDGVAPGADVYFVHSYYAVPQDHGVTLATSDHGHEFCAAVQKDNVMGCQFHPEKSQAVGLKIVENFKNLS